MNGMVVFALLVAPGAPVPLAPPPRPAANVDRAQAMNLARTVEGMAQQVIRDFVREVTLKDLIGGAIRGLHDEAGVTVPDAVTATLARAHSATELVELLADARVLLGNHPNLAGSRSLFAALNGFRHVTDQNCGLAVARANGSFASVEQDFGVGIELDGVAGLRWAIYQVEHGVATGLYGPLAYFGPIPKPHAIPSPAVFPWRVKRVVPGSPAQKAGVHPGDVVTHLNGAAVTIDTADRLFAQFAWPRVNLGLVPPVQPGGQPAAGDYTLTLRRGNGMSFPATLKASGYTPESAFGVLRAAEGKWDCMLDRQAKIGYIRLGPIENGLDAHVAEMMADLVKQGCRGLVLDLRWCPGGYVTPGTQIAGLFLKDGAVVAKMTYRNTARFGPGGDTLASGGGKYATLPLVVLVGHETTGGGELIASALRDNDDGTRCVVLGQRSVGRGSIQNTLETGFAGLQFRLTTGASLRPNGKPRQRTPESKPTDDWGVRPDPGLEVPITADKSAELRREADLHSLRPADSREALAFDDPATDPHRLAALAYLRKKLGPAPAK